METERNEEATKEHLSKAGKGKLTRVISVGLIITICSLIGIFDMYPSPLTFRPSPAMSYAEAAGQTWLLERGKTSISIVFLGTAGPQGFAHALGGSEVSSYPRISKGDIIADHFNYAQNATFGESFDWDRYMISKEEHVKFLYAELWPQIGRFTEDDFSRLERDPSVDRLYSNGETQVWYVHGRDLAKLGWLLIKGK